MTQHSTRRFLARPACLFMACLFMTASPVAAEPAPASPTGQWSFQSKQMPGACVLAGHMDVTRTRSGALTCLFTARWSCKQPFASYTDTEQSCKAKQTGSDIVITSRMNKVTAVHPEDLLEAYQDSYAPDHFKVRINAAGDEMRGIFHSYGHAEVIFRRRVERIG